MTGPAPPKAIAKTAIKPNQPSGPLAVEEASPSDEKEHRAAERNRINRITLGISLLAVIGAIVTAITSLRALNAAIEAANQARRQADAAFADERPYVALINNLAAPQLISAPNGNLQITWSWSFTNYGKTPANHTHINDFISINGEAFEPSYGLSNSQPQHFHPAKCYSTARSNL
jgi:hypothetical protein